MIIYPSIDAFKEKVDTENLSDAVPPELDLPGGGKVLVQVDYNLSGPDIYYVYLLDGRVIQKKGEPPAQDELASVLDGKIVSGAVESEEKSSSAGESEKPRQPSSFRLPLLTTKPVSAQAPPRVAPVRASEEVKDLTPLPKALENPPSPPRQEVKVDPPMEVKQSVQEPSKLSQPVPVAPKSEEKPEPPHPVVPPQAVVPPRTVIPPAPTPPVAPASTEPVNASLGTVARQAAARQPEEKPSQDTALIKNLRQMAYHHREMADFYRLEMSKDPSLAPRFTASVKRHEEYSVTATITADRLQAKA